MERGIDFNYFFFFSLFSFLFFIKGTIAWLGPQLKKYGEGITRAWITAIITPLPPSTSSAPSSSAPSSSPPSPPLLAFLVANDTDFVPAVRERMRTLFFQLLSDLVFKKELAREIAERYLQIFAFIYLFI
jgi:hypothetical protein